MEISSLDILHAEWTYEYAYAMLPFVYQKKVYCSVRDWCPYLLSIAKGWHEKVYWKTSYFMFKKIMQEHRIHFIANSNYTKERITGDYPKNDVTIIPNPIQRSFICDSRDNYPDHPVFVSISQSLQNTRKNYKKLLEAFQLYTKVMSLWLMPIQNSTIFHQQDFVSLQFMALPVVLIWRTLDLQISL